MNSVGYSILRFGAPTAMEACIVMPAIEEIGTAGLDADARRIDVNGLHSTLALPEIPQDLLRLISIDPSRVLLVAVDTLAIPRSALRMNQLRSPAALAPKLAPASLFNEFMNQAVKSGGFTVEHRRVRSRQPESEVFVRKAMFVVQQMTKGIDIEAKYTELTVGHSSSGRANLAAAAVDYLCSHPALARYLDEPGPAESVSAPVLPASELFAVLHAYAFHEIGSALGAAKNFGDSAAAVAAALSCQTGRIRDRVLTSADSVFAQSFADVHAISLCAAFDGADAALQMLTDVRRRRTAGGDFDAYTLAPLSHDTAAGLDLLADDLRRNRDHHNLTRDQLWGQSIWMASESLGAWMQKHGVPSESVAAVLQGLEVAGQIVASASGGISRAGKPAMND